jgi:DNA polymerase alpha-associated DNA helicase A
VPIFKAKKLILAGDPMQLPPTVLALDRPQKKGRAENGLDGKERVKPDGTTKQKKGDTQAQATPKALDDEAGETVDAPPTSESEDDGDDEAGDKDGEDGDEALAESEAIPNTNALEVEAQADVKTDANRKSKERKQKQRGLRPPRTLETTMFARLESMYGPNIKRMLTVQYRCATSHVFQPSASGDILTPYPVCSMHTQIAAFPSKTLYYSKLRSHESVAQHLLKDLPNASVDDEEDAKELLGTPVVFFDTAGCEYFERVEGDNDEGSRCNENEATVAKNWVDALVCIDMSRGLARQLTR